MMKNLFPSHRLSKLDYFTGGAFLAFCYFLFFHFDIAWTGHDSLNYLFGSPLEFYDNCKKFRGTCLGTPYPPSIYAAFALWLSPFKLIGLLTNPNNFPIFLTYWLKALTTLLYAASGVIFYKITQIYSSNKDWSKYATAVWLTTPLAVFSQFIFSQHDIFYVFLTLAAFLMFLRGKLLTASLFFGIAITFKYFPAFVFIPLLLLFEKRIPKLLLYFFVFLIPTLLIQYLYGHSPAFTECVNNHCAIDMIYAASIDVSSWRIFYLFAFFTILCSATYLSEISKDRLPHVAAYVYLVASIFPFLFISWHSQWVIFFTPAVVLTTMIGKKYQKFLIFDLFGMFCFIAAVFLCLKTNFYETVFRGDLLGLHFETSGRMANIFVLFKEHSSSVFFSAFWGYLVTQIALKFKPALQEDHTLKTGFINYRNVRYQFYIGILIFLAPAFLSICKDYISKDRFIVNEGSERHFGELLKNRTFEQSFIAEAGLLEEIDLFLANFARKNSGSIFLEIIDPSNQTIAKIEKSMESIKDNSWEKFEIGPLYTVMGQTYKIRLTSSSEQDGNAITWWASLNPTNSYAKGNAIIDGVSQDTDFAFRIKFSN